jgi:hypothetical protein
MKATTTRKRKRKKCSVEGCPKYSVQGGFCVPHEAKIKRKKCSVEGCPKYSVQGGFCVPHGHGAKVKRKKCSVEGCPKYSQKGGDFALSTEPRSRSALIKTAQSIQ